MTGTGALKTAAIRLAKKGMAVFPLLPRSKLPFPKSHAYKDATKDPELIGRWWSKNPQANIGVATGEPSGVFVLDFDLDKGGEGTVRELERSYFEFPPTVETITGSGGRHVWFQHRRPRYQN